MRTLQHSYNALSLIEGSSSVGMLGFLCDMIMKRGLHDRCRSVRQLDLNHRLRCCADWTACGASATVTLLVDWIFATGCKCLKPKAWVSKHSRIVKQPGKQLTHSLLFATKRTLLKRLKTHLAASASHSLTSSGSLVKRVNIGTSLARVLFCADLHAV